MGVSNGIVTRPFNLEEVAALLVHGNLSVESICVAEDINKWSKHKPIEYGSKLDYLEADEIKGLPEDINAGYIYGVYLANPSTDFLQIHATPQPYNEATDLMFSYKRPSNAGRLTDFDGYYHYAEPDLSVILPRDVYGTGESYTITLNLRHHDLAISYKEIVQANYGTSGSVAPYLFAIVTRVGDYNSTAWTRISSGSINLDSSEPMSFDVPLSGLNLSEGNYILSFFLYNPRSSAEINSFPGVGTWRGVYDTQFWSSNPVLLPNGYKRAIAVSTIVRPYVTAMSLVANSFGVNAAVTLSQSVTDWTQFRMYVSGTINNTYVSTTSKNDFAAFSWDVVSPGSLPFTGMQVNASLSFRCSIDGGNTWGATTEYSATTYVV